MLFKECLLSIFFEFMESCFLSSDLNHIQDGHIRGCSWIGGGGSLKSVTHILQGVLLIKFNNLGLILGTNLEFYTSVAKGFTKIQKVLGANSYVCRSYREKNWYREENFVPPLIWIGLKLWSHQSLTYFS